MSRHYVIQDWSNSATWSGEMIGDRLSKSKGHHFLKNGQANVELYAGDEEDDFKKKSKLSIKDRILPQFKRLETLRTQMIELEKEYKTTEMTCAEYSLLRNVIVVKIQRAEVLYQKAVSVRPKSAESEEDSAEIYTETFSNTSDNKGQGESCSSPVGVRFIDELSETNSLKGALKFSCKALRKAVQFSHKAAAYYRTLKEV